MMEMVPAPPARTHQITEAVQGLDEETGTFSLWSFTSVFKKSVIMGQSTIKHYVSPALMALK